MGGAPRLRTNRTPENPPSTLRLTPRAARGGMGLGWRRRAMARRARLPHVVLCFGQGGRRLGVGLFQPPVAQLSRPATSLGSFFSFGFFALAVDHGGLRLNL